MSRYSDYGHDWDDASILASGRWEVNSRRVFKSKNGQKALRKLRDALLALPEKRLISGALCTVGRSAEVDREKADVTSGRRQWLPMSILELQDNIARQGEGVCAIGALLSHQLQLDGKTREEAAALIPTVCAEGGDGLDDTARAAVSTGMVYTLAWNVAYRNDETLYDATPEERYTQMLTWVESQLADTAV